MARKSTRSASQIGHIEQLEGRALMVADVTASLSSGVLTINGTDRKDVVAIRQGGTTGQTTVYGTSGRALATFATASISAISVSLGNGCDSLSTNLPFTQLLAIKVNMGGGSAESCSLTIGSVVDINVDADSSIGTSVTLQGTAVTGSTNVQFGNGSGQDSLRVQASQLKKLWANMGDDDDKFLTSGSSIESITLSMGAGDDYAYIAPGTGMSGGSINGSTGNDSLVKQRTTLGARLIGFEKVSS